MKSKKPKRGYTLIEMVIVITVIAALSFFAASFITGGIRSWLFIKSRSSDLSQARTSIERIVREIRRINRPQTITTIDPTEFDFDTTAGEVVNFRQSATNLMRNSDIMATGLVTPEGLLFTYYDANKNITAVRTQVRYVTVRLKISSGTAVVTLEDAARIRNI